MTNTPRDRIVEQYAQWTAVSALRSGAPVKKSAVICGLLKRLDVDVVFDSTRGAIASGEFDAWHARAMAWLIAEEPALNVGWAAKIVNVYLKTRVYVGQQGRPGAVDVVHPPIDSGLWKGIGLAFKGRTDILSRTHLVTTIRGIETYQEYSTIISGCRDVARERACRLIEVEQFWAWGE